MISEKVYRALLLAFPGEHRREYGEPMAQLFRDRMRRDGDGFRSLGVWAAMVFDLARSAFTERKEAAVADGPAFKRVAGHSARFLLKSLMWALGLHLALTVAAVVVGLAALLAGWYPFAIEFGYGYAVNIDNKDNFAILVQPSLFDLCLLAVAAGLLCRAGGAAARTLEASLKSWTESRK